MGRAYCTVMSLAASPFSRICGVLVALAILCGASSVAARADQTDPALDALFETLRTTDDPAAARAADREIWRRWLASGDEATDRMMEAGLTAMQTGDLAAAERAFTAVAESRPYYAEAWNKRATVRYYRGDFDGATADCAHVLALEERHYGALSGMGLIQMAMDNKAEALRWFERALMINPHMAGVRANVKVLRKSLIGEPI